MHRNSDLLIAANSRTKNTLLWKVPTAVAKQTTSKSVNPLPPPQNSSKDLKIKCKCCLAEWLLESLERKQIQFMRDLNKNSPCQII